MRCSQPPSVRQDRVVAAALGLLLLAIYLATTPLRFVASDEVAIFSVTRSLLGHASFDINDLFWTQEESTGGLAIQGIDGDSYTFKDIGPSLLAIPFVWVANIIRVFSPMRAALLLSPILTSLTASLLYSLIREWGYSKTIGVIGGLTFGLASMAWPYARTLFGQPLATLGLLIAVIGVERAQLHSNWRAAFVGGLGLGLASTGAIALVITTPAYILYLVDWEALHNGSWKRAVWQSLGLIAAFGLGLGIFGLVHAAYNIVRFGGPLVTGYQAGGYTDTFTITNIGVGGFGQLLSTPRGVIWYAPFALLVPAGWVLGWRTHKRSFMLLLGQMATVFLLYSSYGIWYAGNSWGPRFLVPLMPSLVLMSLPLLERLTKPLTWWAKVLLSSLLLFSATTQTLTALFDYAGTEAGYYEALMSINPARGLFPLDPVLTNLANGPLPRLLTLVGQGRWDVLWMSRGYFDWKLLAVMIVLIALAGIWLVLALRDNRPIATRRGILVQGVASLALMAAMLVRYPHHPSTYTPVQSDPLSNIDKLVEAISTQAERGDGIVFVLPFNYLAWVDRYSGSIPDTGMTFENPLRGVSARRLNLLSQRYNRLWLITEATSGGNPANGVELWLADQGFAGPEMGSDGFRLKPYTFSSTAFSFHPVERAFGNNAVVLASYDFEIVKRPMGGWVNVWLRWRAESTPAENYSVFVHIYDSKGDIVAQHDGWPAAGYSPTSSWVPGQLIEDRHSVMLPSSLPPGEYTLGVGLYDWITGERLPLADASGETLILSRIDIR